MKTLFKILAAVVAVAAIGALALYLLGRGPQPGSVPDEAKQASRDPESMPAADEDYFAAMDGGVTQRPKEELPDVAAGVGLQPDAFQKSMVKGRNTWVVWTGGNDRLWDTLVVKSFGSLDFLKTLSSYPGPIDSNGELMKFSRDNRWSYLGLVNEPCFEKATGPDPERFGLWLDKRIVSPDCPPDPFENEEKYQGVKIGARGQDIGKGKTLPVGSYYGYATGIVGLRLFPNPAFDAKAHEKWDAEKYYNDPSYYYSKDLVRPYRVGMSCAFCHVGPDPTRPPEDPENPRWENLSNAVGAQYFWIDRIFDWRADPSSYVYQMFHSSRPGSLDTSLISTDNINNPRTMNAIYNLGPRLEQAKRFGKETLAGGSADNRQFNDYVPAGSPLAQLFEEPATVSSPRVLKDGADSVGALGALNRVYLNIGLFSEEWLLHFNAIVGGKTVTPIKIADARENSSYWSATEAQTPDMGIFFLNASKPHKLRDAPGGADYLTGDEALLRRGKEVFAETCARCHSSKLPQPAQGLDPGGCSGPNYMNCWKEYWQWTKTDAYKQEMRGIVMSPDFLEGNYLSAEHRVPVSLLQTNACSPLATNAIRDNIWDNFSSETYKELPSAGEITVYNPVTGEPKKLSLPDGGVGYTRPASLVSAWSTAPFLLNNSVGPFESSPKVDARMRSFQASIEQMLWPEKREQDPVLAAAFKERGISDLPGIVDRTTERSYVRIAAGYLPDALHSLGAQLLPKFFSDDEDFKIGPIPAGTPVSLLASLNLRPEGLGIWDRIEYDRKVLRLVLGLKGALSSLGEEPSDEDARKAFVPFVDQMMDLSKCPDYVINRGHYFGTGFLQEEPALSDDDKRALIEFIKTF